MLRTRRAQASAVPRARLEKRVVILGKAAAEVEEQVLAAQAAPQGDWRAYHVPTPQKEAQAPAQVRSSVRQQEAPAPARYKIARKAAAAPHIGAPPVGVALPRPVSDDL